MIRLVLFTFLLRCSLPLGAEQLLSDSQRSVFTYSKNQGLSSQLRLVQDILILKDGTFLQGDLGKIPSLVYLFGKVGLSTEDVALISIPSGQGDKIQIKTRSGQIFIGTPESFNIPFKNKGDAFLTSIDLRIVDSVLVKPTEDKREENNHNRFYLTLKNGDLFPVEIAQPFIELTDGWSTRRIERHQVVDLNFNGGILGTIIGKEGEEDLSLSFTKKPTVDLIAVKGNHRLKIPWKTIAQLCTQERLLLGEKSRDLLFSANTDQPLTFISNHPLDKVDEVTFIRIPNQLFSASEKLVIPNVQFIVEPDRAFTDFQDKDIPVDIAFMETPLPIFDQGNLFDIEQILTVGENFDIEDFEDEVVEPEESEDAVQFVSVKGENTDLRIVVGEDFNIEDFEDEVVEPEESEDAVQFISHGYSQKKAIEIVNEKSSKDDSIVYGQCPCIRGSCFKEMPHEHFSIKNNPKSELDFQVNEEVIPVMELKGSVIPTRPEIPQENGVQPESSEKTDSKGVKKKPRSIHTSDKKEPPREYESLLYVKSGHLDGSGFYIKTKKVTNREYKKFVDAINYRMPLHWVGDVIPKGMEDDPVVNVTYRDAFLYTVWDGKRLPTEQELVRSVEEKIILKDKNNHSEEWTSTPTLRSIKHLQSSNSVKVGRRFSPSHQVFGRYRVVSMNNDNSNNYTGFRIAIDAY